jgi:hypothetical protein
VRHRLAALNRLSAPERRLLLQAWALLLLARLLLRFVPLARLVRRPRRQRSQAVIEPRRVAWLVTIAARVAPGARCLPIALVTVWLLARQGTPATLRIGVARRSGHLTAHAWVDCPGVGLLDASDEDGFAPIVAIPTTVS